MNDIHSFLKAEHFDKQIAFYGDDLCPEQKQLKINGKLRPWKEVQQRILNDGAENWAYRTEGFERWNYKKWTTLRPFTVLPSDQRPETHLFEIVTAASNETPGCFKDHGHSWLRLITPTGEVYSVGFFAPDEFSENPTHPLITLEGVIESPDCYEFIPKKLVERTIMHITAHKFHKLKRLIEAWQHLGIHYNALDQNCSDFLKRCIYEVLPQEERKDFDEHYDFRVSWFYELPNWLQSSLKRVWCTLPKSIQFIGSKVWDRLVTLALSPLALYLGAYQGLRVQSDLDGGIWEVPALIPNVSRLAKLSINLNHARGVRRWQRQQPNYQKGPRFVEGRSRLAKPSIS